uniref:Uncharacterized protein n=1 Tax=Strix occidentalis caurina TaxID=311401 RepID=A0A8D0F4V2_STROC
MEPQIHQATVLDYALAAGATSHAELQVLLLREGSRHLLGCPDGEGELAAGLSHGDGGADVLRADLHVPPGAALPDGQAAPARPLAPVHRAVLEGCREVVYLSLVDLLVDPSLPSPAVSGKAGSTLSHRCSPEVSGFAAKPRTRALPCW